MNNILKLGGILGLLSIVSQVLYRYVLGYDFMFSWKAMVVGLVLMLVLTIVLGKKYFRDPEDGTLGYGDAVKNLFLSYLLSFVIGMVGAALLFGSDPEVGQAFKDYTISATESMTRSIGEMSGQSEADIDASIETLKEQYESGEVYMPDNPYSFSTLPMNLLSGAIYSIIMALILAIFIKKSDSTSYT